MKRCAGQLCQKAHDALIRQIRRVNGGSLKPLCAVVAILAMSAAASAQAPTWKVHLQTVSGAEDPTGIVVDSTGYAVTVVSARGLNMPRCARLDDAQLTQTSRNVVWLMKNIEVGAGEWDGQCRDDPRVKMFIQHGEQALPLRYPLNAHCRDVEPPLALRQLAEQLLELRAKSLERCHTTPR